ncbi:MAG: hypothetical protein AABZ07_02490 [Nitrospirota bacterium]
MSSISGLQQVLSNITGVEKVQHVQQQQAHAELARHTSEGQKSAENTGKKVEDREPVDKVEISVRDDRKGRKGESDKEDKEDKDHEESADNELHIDIRV